MDAAGVDGRGDRLQQERILEKLLSPLIIRITTMSHRQFVFFQLRMSNLLLCLLYHSLSAAFRPFAHSSIITEIYGRLLARHGEKLLLADIKYCPERGEKILIQMASCHILQLRIDASLTLAPSQHTTAAALLLN